MLYYKFLSASCPIFAELCILYFHVLDIIINCLFFIMRGDKIAIRALFHYPCKKKGSSMRAAAKEINDMEGPEIINKCVAQNWFRRFKEGYSSLKDKPRPGRLSPAGDEALLEIVG